ncbi:hypothetical protein [Litorisediminicola beolgyonensis]|uniref:Uncharacterized protein n=1 Tax=Litorisediminicola beolgyonensis TaxID=1173614 RepID=A0ABW3ZET7_9RHOB
MSKYAAKPHKRAARSLGCALTLDTYEAWRDFSTISALRLTDVERAKLAWAALKALEPEQAEIVANTVLGGAGMPIAPLFDELGEAATWVTFASETELDAYCTAAFEAMTEERRKAFLAYANGRAAA